MALRPSRVYDIEKQFYMQRNQIDIERSSLPDQNSMHSVIPTWRSALSLSSGSSRWILPVGVCALPVFSARQIDSNVVDEFDRRTTPSLILIHLLYCIGRICTSQELRNLRQANGMDVDLLVSRRLCDFSLAISTSNNSRENTRLEVSTN